MAIYLSSYITHLFLNHARVRKSSCRLHMCFDELMRFSQFCLVQEFRKKSPRTRIFRNLVYVELWGDIDR